MMWKKPLGEYIKLLMPRLLYFKSTCPLKLMGTMPVQVKHQLDEKKS